VLNAIASSAARTRCARLLPRVSPTIVPRALGSQCGAPSPTNGIVDAPRHGLRLGGCGDDAQSVAQPLHRRAGDEDAALEREHRLAARTTGERREETALGVGAALPGVEQQKRAGAIGVLRLSGLPAALTEQRGLLISRYAADRQLRAEMLRRCRSEVAARIAYFG